MGYAFLSYSTKNQGIADAIRDMLNRKNIETWMAPGDIPAGSRYAQVINQAIKNCACFLLILSRDSQKSVWVAKETERAISYGKMIIPVQIEQVVLNDEFELYLGSNQITAIQKTDENSDEVRKILASVYSATTNQTGDSIKKQSEQQDDEKRSDLPENEDPPKPQTEMESVAIGEYHYFKNGGEKEIIWDVLTSEDNRTLLISRFGLDARVFSNERDKTWDNCSLRKWLNQVFYQEAFSDQEKKAILETQVLPDPNADYDTYAGAPCRDKLFILSQTETQRYYANINDLRCKPTEYAKWRGAFAWGINDCCLWWLRTPGDNSNMITYINAGGGVSVVGCYAQRDEVCVRPAMWVDLSLLE